MRMFLALPLLLLVLPVHAATVGNDDSCDIAVMPAATLLLPHFDVDLESPGRTTLLSITNVTNLDRIARVTLWTDRAYPLLAFNLYLTGYDVQSINLYDVLARGIVASEAGTGTSVTPRRHFSDPNPEVDLTACSRLAGRLDERVIENVRVALLEGIAGDCDEVGGAHGTAVGYATIDVVRGCSARLPTEREYWTQDIAFDNVLVGDYYQVDLGNAFAQGEPMVHIRAVPEGGTPNERRARPANFDAGLPRTFYSRYVPDDLPRRFDGRQPLPSQFAARWIHGGATAFRTFLEIWREGDSGPDASCAEYARDGAIESLELVVFDEAENAVASIRRCQPIGCPPSSGTTTPATIAAAVDDPFYFPQMTNQPLGGWMYLNLDDCIDPAVCGTVRNASQNWVVTSMRAEGRYSVDTPAAALGNGCSRAAPFSEVTVGRHIIGPAPNIRP